MTYFRYLTALVFCLGLLGTARAAGFQMNVLDPTPSLQAVPILTDNFAVTFSACSNYSNVGPNSPIYNDFCFEGINATERASGGPWNSLSLTFSNANLGGSPPICGTLDSADSVFSSYNCVVNGSTDVLTFTMGEILQGSTFIIAEAGISDPSAFGPIAATATTAVPEPNPVLLLSTGVGMLMLLPYAERRRMLRGSIRS